MLLTETKNHQVDNLLHRICGKLQITPTMRDLAESRYKAVADWLSKDENLYTGADMVIYAQGSLNIGTTVKPMNAQEFDLDIVCEFDSKWKGQDPLKLLDAIEKRLKENKTYAAMVERKNRCIRLNYANDFHMDILPAVPADQSNNGCLKVPDRKAENWKDSNPKGYAEWFEKKAEFVTVFFEKKAEIEPFPEEEGVDRKPPLKRAVQLIKRHRDIYFEKNPDAAPISIVLTTLAGHHYQGQESVTVAISAILTGILSSISANGGERLVVKNPSNEREDLSERWENDPQLYEHFVQFVKDFDAKWKTFSETRGIHNIAEELKQMFGETVAAEAVKEQTLFLEELRKSGRLKVEPAYGLMTVAGAGISVKKNTFFGDE